MSEKSLDQAPAGILSVTGRIFDIQRFSIHDGPGIRTTVFLKGCPLGCLWCHNPESRSRDLQLAYYNTLCIGCGRCVEACPSGALGSVEGHVNRDACKVCGACAAECYAGALKIIGKDVTVDEVLKTVMRDLPFYETSGGGITISGGEPLFQRDFTLSLLHASKEQGLHAAIETSGLAPWSAIAEVSEVTDLFLYDLKAIDPAKHQRLCGVDNSTILANARKLAESEAHIIWRTPIVPGCNDSEEDMRLLGKFVMSMPGETRLELMPYHKIGSDKYRTLGMEYQIPDVPSLDNVDDNIAMLKDMGVEMVQ